MTISRISKITFPLEIYNSSNIYNPEENDKNLLNFFHKSGFYLNQFKIFSIEKCLKVYIYINISFSKYIAHFLS